MIGGRRLCKQGVAAPAETASTSGLRSNGNCHRQTEILRSGASRNWRLWIARAPKAGALPKFNRPVPQAATLAGVTSRSLLELAIGIGGCDRPSAVVRGAEEIGETGGRIEARPAKPIDRQIPPDKGGRLGIANDGIVLDVQSHGLASGGLRAHREGSGTHCDR